MKKIELFAGVRVTYQKDGKKFVEYYPKLEVFNEFQFPEDMKTEVIRALIIIYPESVQLEGSDGTHYFFKLIASKNK